MILAPLLLALAQGAAAAPPVPAPPRTVAEDRLTVCLDRARKDPASAIAEASNWAAGVTAPEASYPQQCLGLAYTMLLRWDAAEQAFLLARDAAGADNHFRRAQLATMAGNAALAGGRAADALTLLERAAGDAAATGDNGLRAMVEVDRARAQVMLGREADAANTLAAARTLDPQSPFAWLLSATLARRLGKLDEAQGYIETAAQLSPDYPEIGLEAGVIAMLAGRQEAAEASWRSVIRLAPDSPEAVSARAYLAQAAEIAADAPSAPAESRPAPTESQPTR
jgi:tetratricopeptide (TPR) repeat protein